MLSATVTPAVVSAAPATQAVVVTAVLRRISPLCPIDRHREVKAPLRQAWSLVPKRGESAYFGYRSVMPRVLIVEDDPTIRTAVMRALTDRGYAVAAAHTAMSGLQLAVSDHPDVVILDLGLPDMDGAEVLRMLRAVSRSR